MEWPFVITALVAGVLLGCVYEVFQQRRTYRRRRDALRHASTRRPRCSRCADASNVPGQCIASQPVDNNDAGTA